jgi:hypothetical protein
LILFSAICAIPALSDWAEPEPQFVFARLQCTNRDSWDYWPTYFPNNPPWHHDYPFSDELFIGLVHELTGIHVSPNSYKIVRLDNPEIFKYPFLYLSEPGFLALNDKEIANLGEYIRRGGFIMADDFRTAGYISGTNELEVLKYYLKLAVPERELVRLNVSHPIFHSFFDIDTLNMDSPYPIEDRVTHVLLGKPEFWGMMDGHGNLQLIANFNNDIGDFWKYLDLGDKPLKDSARATRLGINYLVYALSH